MFEQLRSLTNAELYEEAFHKRLMLPHPTRPGEFLGNDQRALFLPQLRSLLKRAVGGRVLDVGAGSGEMVELALREMPRCELYIEEPNSPLRARYEEKVSQFPNIQLKSSFAGPLEDIATTEAGRSWFASVPSCDAVLAVHMIYHVPENLVADAVAFLFSKLAKGGAIFLVFAERSSLGKAGLYYLRACEANQARAVERTWKMRTELFADRRIQAVIAERFPSETCEVTSVLSPSRVYGRTVEDLAIMAFTGEISGHDRERVDLRKLELCYEYLTLFPKDVDLRTEASGDRKGMVSVAQPQIICEIRKN